MKSVDCDQVFEILTIGPFPTGGAGDDAVESHLADCAACRRLAEALAPALDLIHESLADEEAAGLPEYWGEHAGLLTDSRCESRPNVVGAASFNAASAAEALRAEMRAAEAAVSVAAASRPANVEAGRALLTRVGRWGALAAIVLLAVGVGRWSAGLAGVEDAPPARGVPLVAQNVDWDAFGVVQACREPLPFRASREEEPSAYAQLSPLVAHASADVRCCTHCHAAGKASVAHAPSKLLLAQACMICHVSLP